MGLTRWLTATALRMTNVVPSVHLQHVAAAMLDGVVHGFASDTLLNEDLGRIGARVLGEDAEAKE